MVMQRDQPIHVWGWATADETVSVDLDGTIGTATCNTEGRFDVSLTARVASAKPIIMAVKAGNPSSGKTY